MCGIVGRKETLNFFRIKAWAFARGMEHLEGRRACHWRILWECFFQNCLSLTLSTFFISHFFPPFLATLIFANKRKLDIHIREYSKSQNEGVKISFSFCLDIVKCTPYNINVLLGKCAFPLFV